MSFESQQFGLDLFRLWLVGNRDLPEIAERFADANSTLEAGSNDEYAFGHAGVISPTSSVQYQGTVTSRVFTAWDGLRDELQQVLAISCNNTYDAAEALIRVMNNYAETDDAARVTLNQSIACAHNGEYIDPELQKEQPNKATVKEKIADYDPSNRKHPTGRH